MIYWEFTNQDLIPLPFVIPMPFLAPISTTAYQGGGYRVKRLQNILIFTTPL
jgi:hypothetical protein